MKFVIHRVSIRYKLENNADSRKCECKSCAEGRCDDANGDGDTNIHKSRSRESRGSGVPVKDMYEV